MDSDQETALSEVRAFVRGERGREDLEKLGIEIKEIKDGYEFANPQHIVAKVSLRDVAQGLLRFRSDLDALRTWSGLVLAGSSFIDFDPGFEGNPDGGVLLDALWNAWFRRDIGEDAFVVAEKLV